MHGPAGRGSRRLGELPGCRRRRRDARRRAHPGRPVLARVGTGPGGARVELGPGGGEPPGAGARLVGHPARLRPQGAATAGAGRRRPARGLEIALRPSSTGSGPGAAAVDRSRHRRVVRAGGQRRPGRRSPCPTPGWASSTTAERGRQRRAQIQGWRAHTHPGIVGTAGRVSTVVMLGGGGGGGRGPEASPVLSPRSGRCRTRARLDRQQTQLDPLDDGTRTGAHRAASVGEGLGHIGRRLLPDRGLPGRPIDPGGRPIEKAPADQRRPGQWGGWGSNPRPRDYESRALTTELPPRGPSGYATARGPRSTVAPDATMPRPRGHGASGSSGGGARTHDNRINSAALCQLSYPGMASRHSSSASTRPITARCVLVHEYRTAGQPIGCFDDRIDGSATARYGLLNWLRGMPVRTDQYVTASLEVQALVQVEPDPPSLLVDLETSAASTCRRTGSSGGPCSGS